MSSGAAASVWALFLLHLLLSLTPACATLTFSPSEFLWIVHHLEAEKDTAASSYAHVGVDHDHTYDHEEILSSPLSSSSRVHLDDMDRHPTPLSSSSRVHLDMDRDSTRDPALVVPLQPQPQPQPPLRTAGQRQGSVRHADAPDSHSRERQYVRVRAPLSSDSATATDVTRDMTTGARDVTRDMAMRDVTRDMAMGDTTGDASSTFAAADRYRPPRVPGDDAAFGGADPHSRVEPHAHAQSESLHAHAQSESFHAHAQSESLHAHAYAQSESLHAHAQSESFHSSLHLNSQQQPHMQRRRTRKKTTTSPSESSDFSFSSLVVDVVQLLLEVLL